MAGLNLKYMKEKGGMDFYEKESVRKSNILYEAIESSDGYYISPVDVRYRSTMNIPFRVKNDEALETKFLKEAEAEGLIDLKGHRTVGGIRASIYNAMPTEGV
jgi:phosphoserine aminotransferase